RHSLRELADGDRRRDLDRPNDGRRRPLEAVLRVCRETDAAPAHALLLPPPPGHAVGDVQRVIPILAHALVAALALVAGHPLGGLRRFLRLLGRGRRRGGRLHLGGLAGACRLVRGGCRAAAFLLGALALLGLALLAGEALTLLGFTALALLALDLEPRLLL